MKTVYGVTGEWPAAKRLAWDSGFAAALRGETREEVRHIEEVARPIFIFWAGYEAGSRARCRRTAESR
jgi:hypothetical protein